MSNSLMASFDRGSGIATGSLAAQTRMVSVVGFAPERTGVITNFKYLARARIFEFESHMPSHGVGLCGAMCCGNRRRTSHRTRWLRDEWWRCRVGDAPAGRVTDRSVVPCCRKPRLGKGPPDLDHAKSQFLTSSNRSQGLATMVNPPKIGRSARLCHAKKNRGERCRGPRSAIVQ